MGARRSERAQRAGLSTGGAASPRRRRAEIRGGLVGGQRPPARLGGSRRGATPPCARQLIRNLFTLVLSSVESSLSRVSDDTVPCAPTSVVCAISEIWRIALPTTT